MKQVPGRPKSGVYLKCETCSKEFYVTQSRLIQVEQQGNTIRYCSVKCYDKTGNKNPFWGKKHSEKTLKKLEKTRPSFGKGKDNPNFIRFAENNFIGISNYWWQKYLRKNISKCEQCGYSEHVEILEVHHLDKNKENNKRENLKLFCPNCHEVWHLLDNSGRYTKYENKKRK